MNLLGFNILLPKVSSGKCVAEHKFLLPQVLTYGGRVDTNFGRGTYNR